VRDNPKAYDAHFVLGYHYLTCGHKDRAVEELLIVNKAVPNDTVTAQLLQMLGKAPVPAAPAIESNAKIDVDSLLGTWTATRGGKAQFEMTLGKDKGFTWGYQEGKKKEKVSGAFAIDGNVLAMEPDAGGVMLAELTGPNNGELQFRTVGAPASDPGLTFRKK
jgi:hypothetical protein